MTAITICAPLTHRRSRTAHRPAGLRSLPAVRPARTPSLGMRLTRRGRLTITALLASIGLAVSLVAGGAALAGTSAEPAPVSYLTIEPGETLWAIAGQVAPQVDRRDTVARILELNALDSANVQAGQRIAVPAAG